MVVFNPVWVCKAVIWPGKVLKAIFFLKEKLDILSLYCLPTCQPLAAYTVLFCTLISLGELKNKPKPAPLIFSILLFVMEIPLPSPSIYIPCASVISAFPSGALIPFKMMLFLMTLFV